ncbi:MAG: hypothetical protein COA73_05730 [Candidatus Hydrogenedentota bacterium]|nr:MAG: hypothetical protein COA73_05730 [Candidatus Hydrogenedentota bacterium]
MGDYEGALANYDAITDTYASLRELDEAIVEAYLHLHRISDALVFVRSRENTPDWMIKALERHAAKPFSTSLETLSVVPFADHELTDYFPAFSVNINGQDVIAHVDTGGAFLYMSPERAKALAFETFPGLTERAHKEWMKNGEFYANPVEIDIDPDVLIRKVREGAGQEELRQWNSCENPNYKRLL